MRTGESKVEKRREEKDKRIEQKDNRREKKERLKRYIDQKLDPPPRILF